MITRHKHNDLVWVDLEMPTDGEVAEIMREFDINGIVARELVTPSVKSKVELYSNYIYLILHFPAIHSIQAEGSIKEVDFIIGRNFIVTAHYSDILAFNKFSKLFEVNSILDHNDLGNHAGHLFYHMIKEIYQGLYNELESIKDALERAQEKIFQGEEKAMVSELSSESRKLLDFSRAIKLHKEVLESFDIAGGKFFGEEFSFSLRTIMAEYLRVKNAVSSNRALLAEIRETNNSLLSTKQNEIMKTLTIMAFVTFPLTLIAAIFSLDTTYTPIVGHPYDFWIIIGLMALLTLSFFAFFKYKKWL